MSNKIVPTIYRSVIDDVIASIKPEFDEYGVSEDVLAELQSKWENKVMQSHVAEFDPPAQAPLPQPAQHPQPIHQSYPPHPMHMMQTHPHYGHPYGHMAAAPVAAPSQPAVKTEPNDSASRYLINPYSAAGLSPLPGPNLAAAARPPTLPPHPGGQTTAYSIPRPLHTQYPATVTNGTRPAYSPPQPAAAPGQTAQRIPQVDGPSESSEDEGSPSPSPAFAPRANHPSLPQPVAAQPRQRTPGDEAINSELDDSDTDGEDEADEGNVGEPDIVFCTYDKVARVKNKWKCILKDGMIHVNGKDYLFAKCTGEFEW